MIHTRPWQTYDHHAVNAMLTDLLTSTSEAGADMLPTAHNVRVLTDLGMRWAAQGEPTLMALDDALPVGCILWGNLGNPLNLDLRAGSVCAALGTYVMPAYRRQHVALLLRQTATEMAIAKGYKRIQGTAFHDAGILSAQFAGFTATGAILELRI